MTDNGNQVAAPQWQQLVNNKVLSDVSFAVGQEGTLIYGHRSLMAAASDVFFRMFTSEIAPTGKDPIKVPDIDSDTFLEMVKFIYYDASVVSEDNLVKLYYAAEKYNLSRLIDRCLSFVSSNEELTLNIFKANIEYGFERLYEVCLEIIGTNPFKIFKSSEFLELPFELVKKIAGQSTLRCNTDQLMEALQKWNTYQKEDANGDEALEKLTVIVEKHRKRDFQFRKIVFFGKIWQDNNNFIIFKVNALVPLNLYGVGICVGIQDGNYLPVNATTLNISISIENVQVCYATAPFRKDVYIYDCMFEEYSLRAKSSIALGINVGVSNTAIGGVCFTKKEYNYSYDSMAMTLTMTDGSSYIPALAYILYRT